MSQIPNDLPNCNGWAVIDGQYVDAENAKNVHVAECIISHNQNGGISWSCNHDRKTICGEQLGSSRITPIGISEDDATIRTKLALLEEKGIEVCGTCTSHFYADR